MAMFEHLGEMTYDNLVNDSTALIVEARKIAASAPELKRGTALGDSEDGYVVLASGGTPIAIAADDIEAGAGVGNVYLTGRFNRERVDEITGYTLTDEDVENFRKVGIHLTWERP